MRSCSLLWILLAASLFFLGFSAVLEQNDEPRWEQLEAERDALNAQGVSTTYRTSTIDPEAVELDLGNQVKPGLFSTGTNSTKKTIFLIDGEASSSATYVLNLRSEEKLLSVVHVTNDSEVITTHSKQVREISGAPAARYNISLAHEFERSVGVASYILHVTTSYARYISSGTFYVSGIVALVDGDNSSLALVSGMGSPGLSFPNPGSVSIKDSSTGQVPLSIVYQAPGPDVMETTLTLAAVMNSAQFHVQDSGTESEAPLLNYNSTECGSLSDIQKDESGYFVFPDPMCGIGFQAATQEIVINLNRERSGTVVITFSIPLLAAHGEIFESSINIFIGTPSIKKPVLVLDGDLDLVLDYYGSEEFSVKMYNIITPEQPYNATAVYMNLPGMRYATSDFSKSKLINPIQIITFKSVQQGEEDEKVLKLLKAASYSSNYTYVNLTESLSDPANSSATSENENMSSDSQTPLNVNLIPDETKNETSVSLRVNNNNAFPDEMYDDTLFKRSSIYVTNEYRKSLSPDLHSKAVLHMEIEDTQSSDVYVVIPPNDVPIKAVSSGQGMIRTALASKELAVIDTKESAFPEKVSVTMAFEGYSISDFSEHKSGQIKMALLQEALGIKNGTEGEIVLVNLRNDGSKLIAEYEIFVSDNSEEIAAGLLEKGMATRIAKKAYLEEHRVEIVATMASMFKDVPGNLAGSENGLAVASASSGVIIAAIVILSFVVAIPILALCFGFIVTRRHQQEDTSDMDGRDLTPTEATTAVPGDQSAPPSTITSPVARDGFGRGDEVTSESFKMQKELYKEGYFGDNKSSSTQTKEN